MKLPIDMKDFGEKEDSNLPDLLDAVLSMLCIVIIIASFFVFDIMLGIS